MAFIAKSKESREGAYKESAALYGQVSEDRLTEESYDHAVSDHAPLMVQQHARAKTVESFAEFPIATQAQI